jgi:3-deoxy-7-phosphoheptulonate synthase
MSDLLELERHQLPHDIHAAFRAEESAYNYQNAFQPQYPNPDAELAAIHELHATEPVTSPERVMAVRKDLADIALGGAGCVVLTNRCNEPVRAGDESVSIGILADEANANTQAVEDGMRDAGIDDQTIEASVNGQRMAGQAAKPRSSEKQKLDDASEVQSYMGDMINGMDVNDRTPDPTRMVAAAVQARDLRAVVEDRTGRQPVTGHEALLLPYVSSFVYADDAGKKWYLGADTPWIGERTNKPPKEGEVNHHVELLSQVENTVGVKIGPKSDAEHIKWLSGKLNPNNEPGKMIFMVRVGDDEEAMTRILDGIKEHAPTAIVMYDIHGSTETDEDGTKIRSVEKTVSDIELLDTKARERDMRVRGVHLETLGNATSQQCVDRRDQKPKEKPEVDPLFNTVQTRKIIGQVAAKLV